MNSDFTIKERSLIVFTQLTQLSIGAFWMLSIIHWWASAQVDSETAGNLTSIGFLVIIPLMVTALLFSLLHLGTPRNAWRAAANLRTSWLSREIVFTLLFTGIEAVFTCLQWTGLGSDWLRLLLCLVTALAGGLALFSMARLYMLRTISSWNNWTTPLAFIISTLLLGGLATGISLALNSTARGDLLRLPLIWISLLALFLLSMRIVLVALYPATRQLAQAKPILILQMSLLAFTLSINAMLLYQCFISDFSGRSVTLSWLVLLAFLTALAEEILGRFLFYLSFERVGI